MASTDKNQIQEIVNLIYRKFGIHIPHSKKSSLCLKLDKMIAHEKYANIGDIYKHLVSGDQQCLDTLIRYITTNHTFFFREHDHFKKLVSCIHANPQQEIKIWCAACSSGEEPYSIAMTLFESNIRNFKIIASDIDTGVLGIFNHGLYNESRFIKTPLKLRQRYFTQEGENYFKITPALRRYISIKNLNLMDNLLFEKQLDYVFCRNVFIYFNDDSRKKAMDTLVRNLRTGGRLFIGHTETLLYDLPSLKKDGQSVYLKL